jgi:hypothetical protein
LVTGKTDARLSQEIVAYGEKGCSGRRSKRRRRVFVEKYRDFEEPTGSAAIGMFMLLNQI